MIHLLKEWMKIIGLKIENYLSNRRYSDKLSDIWYWVENRFFARYDLIRTGLSKSDWHEIEERMLYGMMGFIVEYVEKQEGMKFIDWSAYPKEQEDIRLIYYWWKNYSNREKEIDEALSDWADSKGTKEEKEKFIRHMDLEKKLDLEETDALKMIVDLRKTLWI